MSNRVHLDRETVTIHKNSQVIPTLKVYDDFGEDSYTFFELPGEDLDCLKNCIKQQKEEQWEGNSGVLQRIYDNKMSISIDDISYSWDEIKHLFEGWNDDEDD